MDFTDKPQMIEHICKSLNYTVYDTKWVPSSARLVVLGMYARGTGTLQTYELADGSLNLLSEVEKKDAFKSGSFAASMLVDRHLASGNFKGMLEVWNLERMDSPIYSAKAHNSLINSIDGCGGLGVGIGAPEIVTGSRDGTVRVWDTRQKDVPVAALEPADGQEPRDCWAVAFGNAYNAQDRCVAAGYDNGDVKLWDLKTNSIRWETNLSNGVCSVEFDRKDIQMNKLMATTLENQIATFDLRTQHPEEGFAKRSHNTNSGTVWCGRFLPQNRELCCIGGGNGNLMLFKYNYPKQRSVKDENGVPKGVPGTMELINEKNFSTQPINSFDWHPDKEGLCAFTSFDQCLRVAIITRLNKF